MADSIGFRAPLRLKLDGSALVSNWQWLADTSRSAACGAAVKANGYGLGARDIVTRLAKAGCRQFFVAHWGEAEAIADLVPPHQIAVLNGLDADDPAYALTLGALPVLNTPQQIQRWKSAGGGACHVMLDSGINRLGLGPEQIDAHLFDNLDIDILLSHLASADEDVPQNGDQLATFRAMANGLSAKRKSLANSAGILLGDAYHFDLTRPGLSLYGGIARPDMEDHIRPVVQPEAMVLQMRTVPDKTPIGYNATFVTSGSTPVATLAIGYADGYGRGFSNAGHVRFNGKRLPVIGRVSMDLLLVNASLAPELREGDWVAVEFELRNASMISGLSQYELLTGIGHRADRIWI